MSANDRVLRERRRVDYREVDDSDSASDTGTEEGGYASAVDNSFVDNRDRTVIGEEEEFAVAMANSRVVELAAELDSIFFQLEESNENVEDDIDNMNIRELTILMNEMKELRVALVKSSSALALLCQPTHERYKDRVELLKRSSKTALACLKVRLHSLEASKESAEAARRQEMEHMENSKARSKVAAFNRSLTEIQTMFVKLNASYTAAAVSLSRDQMLKRAKDVSALSSEFDTFRDRVDRLINQTDVVFDQKETKIDEAVELLGKLTNAKELHEKRVHNDLITNDLTEDKLKLAEATKIDVGKFSGVLGVGDDFYTFKTKFLKAYGNHPKNLMVEWLKNNHLQGVAKDCVGNLEDLDNIWHRLMNNFGNTEQMLQYQFGGINKLGPMPGRKSYTAKKTLDANLDKYYARRCRSSHST